jgi:hypothetical protein
MWITASQDSICRRSLSISARSPNQALKQQRGEITPAVQYT